MVEQADQHRVLITEHVQVPMADGVRLSARLWLPESATRTPVPVVLEYIPYRKRDLYRFHDNAWGAILAANGIAFARIDVRGTGDSEGVITDEYSEVELDDGEQCIAWLAAQRWSSGRVGMRGISWGAINTLQIAARQPPALHAIVPIAGTDHRYTDDAHYPGGLLGRPNLDWGVLFKTVLAGPPDPDVVGAAWEEMWQKRLDATPAVITGWLRHQSYDGFWQRGSIELDYSAIRCPTYLVAGWYDTYVNPVGRMLAALEVPKKALIGPWGHTYPELARPGGVDWAKEELRWWRHWLLDEDSGLLTEPQLHAFLPYATPRAVLPAPVPGRWVAEPRWPIPDQPWRILRFGRDGLSDTAGPGEALKIPAEQPVGFGKAEWLDALPAEQGRDDGHSLCFDTAPLPEDLEILGYPSLRLRIAADRPVAAVTARLTEVDERGESHLISYGMRNLTHRAGHDAPRALLPGEFVDVDIPLYMIAHRFGRGQRIRLALSDALWPMSWPTPVQAQLTIATGGCALSLPVRTRESQPIDVPMASFDEPAVQAPEPLTPVTFGPDGSFRYDRSQPSASYPAPDTGTILSSESKAGSRLERDGANFWHAESRRGWQRGEWHCEVVAGCEISADSAAFTVREYLKAYRSGKQIFERDESAVIPRCFL